MQKSSKQSAMQEIVNTLARTFNEYTNAPYWLILDPRQNMLCDIHSLAADIKGPFFSRQDAEDFLEKTRYNFSKRAAVYCMSGCYSDKYSNLCKELHV
jgi:hypothetical protein